jgi:hypothetical protein
VVGLARRDSRRLVSGFPLVREVHHLTHVFHVGLCPIFVYMFRTDCPTKRVRGMYTYFGHAFETVAVPERPRHRKTAHTTTSSNTAAPHAAVMSQGRKSSQTASQTHHRSPSASPGSS